MRAGPSPILHNIPLARATAWAEKIVDELTPYCKQPPRIAGSIRRKRPTVNDVDLVVLAKGDGADLRARCKKNAVEIVEEGEMTLIVILKSGLQLDIWFAREPKRDLFGVEIPGNFGSLLLCRTGSKEHNIWLCNQAADRGLHWNPYAGLHGKPERPGGPCPLIAGETEESIFKALNIPFIKPEDRER
jgi:DNA polymerase (family 10)